MVWNEFLKHTLAAMWFQTLFFFHVMQQLFIRLFILVFCRARQHSVIGNTTPQSKKTLSSSPPVGQSLWSELLVLLPGSFSFIAAGAPLSLMLVTEKLQKVHRHSRQWENGFPWRGLHSADAFNLVLGAEPGLGNVPQCYYCLDAVVKIHLIPEPML